MTPSSRRRSNASPDSAPAGRESDAEARKASAAAAAPSSRARGKARTSPARGSAASAPAAARRPTRAGIRAIARALDHLMDEGIRGVSIESVADRRRAAALNAGFAAAEALLGQVTSRTRIDLAGRIEDAFTDAELRTLLQVARDLCRWATLDGANGGPAVDSLRRALATYDARHSS